MIMGYVVGDDTINLNTENLKSGIMDYEKKYKEALERAKHYLTIIGVSPDEEPINVLKRFSEYVFSELVESEDEKIRKELLIDIPKVFPHDKAFKYIAWVEKQGEHANFRNKIQIGDKVTRNEDGVLVNLSQLKRVAKPADKIQLGKKYKCIASPRYTAFMKGSIYEPKDKFLCSLMNFCSDCFEPVEDGEQKPAEEYNITGIGSKNAQGKLGEMIKNLKSAWSDEDEKILSDIIKDLVHPWNEYIPDRIEYEIKWLKNRLKSLKDRYTWKPSDEQMKALADALSLAKNCGEESAFDLRTLYEQLKKLKG